MVRPEHTLSPDHEVFIPVARACAFADAHDLPRRIDVINRYRILMQWPAFVLIGPGALDPMPVRA